MKMLQERSYALVFGKPVIMWSGLLALASFAIVAVIGARVLQGKAKFESHKRAVIVSFALAAIHAILGIAAYF